MSEERITLPKLAIAGNMIVERDTVGTDNPRFVAKIEMGERRADFIRNTTIMLEVVRRYNASLTWKDECDYDFSGLSDMDLVQLQKEMRGSDDPSDKEYLNAILVELGHRQR